MGRPRAVETRRVPIPEGAVVYSNGRVLDKGRRFHLPGDFVIGHRISDTTLMSPNENYFRFHMQEYSLYDPEGASLILPAELKAGLYLLVLTAAKRFGIYRSLIQRFDPVQANAVMDYVMFLLKGRNNSTKPLPSVLQNEVSFTGSPYDESWYICSTIGGPLCLASPVPHCFHRIQQSRDSYGRCQKTGPAVQKSVQAGSVICFQPAQSVHV